MLVTLGARATSEDVVDLLAACHRRIRQHVVLARRLAYEGPTRPLEEVAGVARQIGRYFAEALPLHVADEDTNVAAALAHHGGEVAAALATLARDHVLHQGALDQLTALCDEIAGRPERLGELVEPLTRVVDALARELAAHLELEERVIFPALRELPASTRDGIRAAIRHRRSAARA